MSPADSGRQKTKTGRHCLQQISFALFRRRQGGRPVTVAVHDSDRDADGDDDDVLSSLLIVIAGWCCSSVADVLSLFLIAAASFAIAVAEVSSSLDLTAYKRRDESNCTTKRALSDSRN